MNNHILKFSVMTLNFPLNQKRLLEFFLSNMTNKCMTDSERYPWFQISIDFTNIRL